MAEPPKRPGTSSTLRRRVEVDPVLHGLVRALAEGAGADVVLVVFGLPGGRVFELHRGLAAHQRHAHLVLDLDRLLASRPGGVALGANGDTSLPYALSELVGLRSAWAFPIGDPELGRLGVLLVGRRAEGLPLDGAALEALAEPLSHRVCRILGRAMGAWTRPEIPAADPAFGRVASLLDRLGAGPLREEELQASRSSLVEALVAVKALQDLVELPLPAASPEAVAGVRRSLRAVRAFGLMVRPFLDGDGSPWAVTLFETARVKMLGEDPELRLLAGRLRALGLVDVSPR